MNFKVTLPKSSILISPIKCDGTFIISSSRWEGERELFRTIRCNFDKSFPIWPLTWGGGILVVCFEVLGLVVGVEVVLFVVLAAFCATYFREMTFGVAHERWGRWTGRRARHRSMLKVKARKLSQASSGLAPKERDIGAYFGRQIGFAPKRPELSLSSSITSQLTN